MRLAIRPCACLMLVVTSGCAVGPNFHRPAQPQTARYTAQPLAETATASPSPNGQSGDAPVGQYFLMGQNPASDWWHGFGSSDIDALIEQALKANPTMQAAEATLRQAHENVAAQRGAYYPEVQAGFAASKNRNAVQVLAPTLSSGVATFELYTPQLTVSFVPDVFGGNRRQVESLKALEEASTTPPI
jgi:outer membrane protein TolC